jgi:hypothetical protein
MVVGPHAQAERAERGSNVAIAPAMLGQPMYQQHRAKRLGKALGIGQPGAQQQLGAIAHSLACLGGYGSGYGGFARAWQASGGHRFIHPTRLLVGYACLLLVIWIWILQYR